MSNVITKHKDLSERFVAPAYKKLLQHARNLYLYGETEDEILEAVRSELQELKESEIPVVSPRGPAARISDKEPVVASPDVED